MPTTQHPEDPRLAALADWLAGVLDSQAFALAPASSDASFRRYFRATLAAPHALAPSAPTLIAMDAPPPQENCAPFVRVASLLRAAGVHAPQVLAQDLDRGYLLLTDLGDTTYLSALDADSADRLYEDALDALVRFQVTSREGVLPPYDEALLRRELDLFPDWYVARHLSHALDAGQRAALGRVFALVLESNLAQPRVFVHRDYHSRNLMVCADPIPACSTSRTRSTVPSPTISSRCCATPTSSGARSGSSTGPCATGRKRARPAFRFVRISGRSGATSSGWACSASSKCSASSPASPIATASVHYLADMPLVMRYLRGACGRYRELAPLPRCSTRSKIARPRSATPRSAGSR